MASSDAVSRTHRTISPSQRPWTSHTGILICGIVIFALARLFWVAVPPIILNIPRLGDDALVYLWKDALAREWYGTDVPAVSDVLVQGNLDDDPSWPVRQVRSRVLGRVVGTYGPVYDLLPRVALSFGLQSKWAFALTEVVGVVVMTAGVTASLVYWWAPAACLSADETKAAMKLWIGMAVDFCADTIFWDEPHLYIPEWDDLHFAPDNAFACFCPRCRDSFQDRFGQPMPTTLTVEMRAFREELMLDFLAEMISYARDKGVKNAITLLPVDDEASESLPWKRIANIRGLDIFGTDPYWYLHNKNWQVCFCTDETRHGCLRTS